MILATRRNGTRDGQLVVVAKTRATWVDATKYAPTMQQALDQWEVIAPRLKELYDAMNEGKVTGNPIELEQFQAPLPRAYEWVDGSSYINHIVLVRKARHAEPPETLRTDPLVYQGGSSFMLGPTDAVQLADETWGCDFESEIAVILGDTPQGTTAEEAEKYVRLVTIVNDVSLRNLIPNELAKGFGFFNSKPASAFAAFALTPDELGSAWKQGRVHLDLETKLNGTLFGNPNAGPEMHFSFYELIQHICKTRAYTAGTILGSGTVSNEDRSRGSSCLAEKRTLETIDTGSAKTPFLRVGDEVEINLRGPDGKSLCGPIKNKIVPWHGKK